MFFVTSIREKQERGMALSGVKKLKKCDDLLILNDLFYEFWLNA